MLQNWGSCYEDIASFSSNSIYGRVNSYFQHCNMCTRWVSIGFRSCFKYKIFYRQLHGKFRIDHCWHSPLLVHFLVASKKICVVRSMSVEKKKHWRVVREVEWDVWSIGFGVAWDDATADFQIGIGILCFLVQFQYRREGW